MRRLIALLALVVGSSESGSSLNGTCEALSLHDCRLAEGCKPDICAGCICDLNFRGCVAANAQVASCPALGCPSGICCRDNQQCDGSGGVCTQPDTPQQGCGACNTTPGDCTSDATCMATSPVGICEPIPCSCDGQMACTQGCLGDENCAEGQRCNRATARCGATPCTVDEECPAAFHCGGTCVRDLCNTDDDCDGFCVLGECFARSLGQCFLPTP